MEEVSCDKSGSRQAKKARRKTKWGKKEWKRQDRVVECKNDRVVDETIV